MRLVKRNLKPVYYQLYGGKGPIIDEEGYETGDTDVSYTNPVKLMCNVSPATGKAQSETFGALEDYDKVVITDQMDCPIDEHSVLFVDRIPVWEEGVLQNTHDYVVKRVAKSLTHISYAIAKAEVA